MDATAVSAAILLVDVAAGGDVAVALSARGRCLLVTSSVRTTHALDGPARVRTAREAAARLGRERTGTSPIARASVALLPDAEALDLGRDAFAEVPADARRDDLPRLSEAAARLPPSVARGLWGYSEAREDQVPWRRPPDCEPAMERGPTSTVDRGPEGGRPLERDTDCGS
ncbi:hypothetical protein [Sorangium sp. So ce1335]|uniref:hypothetical protein n=1 Tax=Sorangium sp. So ce1335 TaxID=3133335 RepID=UPI003F5F35E9